MNIETKSIPNFLQVSVNTDKLNHFFVAVSNTFSNHDKQIQQLSREVIQLKMQLQQKISKIKSEFEYEKERADKKRKDDDTFFNTLVQDSTRKHQKLVQKTRQQFIEIEQEIGYLKNLPMGVNKINQLKLELEQHKLNTCNGFTDLNSKLKTLETQIKNSGITQDFLLKNMVHAYENKGKNEPQKQKKVQYQHEFVTLRPNRHFTGDDLLNKEKTFSIQKSVNQSKQSKQMKQAREKKKKKNQQRNQLQNLQYASVSAKLDALDLRLTAKENQSLNKIMWASKNAHLPSEPSEKDQENSVERIESQNKNLQYRITTKLEHIQNIIYQKIAFDEKQLSKLKNTSDLLKDLIEIANRRIEKESQRISDYFLQFKKIEEKRVDQKIIDNFITMFKRQIRLLQQQIEQRIQKEEWQKQQSKIASKIDLINDNVTEKAEKEEVKKAFRFIEDKIKQIVLIMAEEQQAERDGGACKKIPYKCLSCDKQLENSLGITQRPHLQTRLASRGSTSNLRKRIRQGNNQEK